MVEASRGWRNRLKESLLAGEPSFGVIATIPSLQSVQVLANAGVDWLIIDMEHAPIDLSAAQAMIVATAGTSTVPLADGKRVLGSGFSTSPVIGELWVRDESRGFRWPTRLRWNEFEDEGHPETLTDSRKLSLSGNGEMTIAESTISGALVGTAILSGSGSEIRCSGSHRFTFTRPSL